MSATIAEKATAPKPHTVLRSILATIGIAAVLLSLAAGFGRYRFGSTSAALAYLRGAHIFVPVPVATLTDAKAGSQVTASFALTNLASFPVTLVGSTTSCSCTVLDDLPMTLAVGETTVIKAKISIDQGQGDFSGTIRIFTDDISLAEIKLGYAIRVALPREPQSN